MVSGSSSIATESLQSVMHCSTERPQIRKPSEHGLGHLLNPVDPDDTSRDWIEEVWSYLVAVGLGLDVQMPGWVNRPAISRITTSTPMLLKPFGASQPDNYQDQVKPFNFVLSAHVALLGHPNGVDRTKFHLIAPFDTDPRAWRKTGWTDIYSQKQYAITTTGEATAHRAKVKSYRDVIEEYAYHPESKSADSEGRSCDRQTVGLLQRRHVQVAEIRYIGKESNRLEDVEHGLVHNWDDVRETYENPNDRLWADVVLPKLREIPTATLIEKTGLGERQVRRVRNGARPKKQVRSKLMRCVAVGGVEES